MTRHRFINDGRSPIPMGATAEYACVCGKRGTHAAIERHITEMQDLSASPDHAFGGGDTKAHYLPMAPREPAPSTFDEAEVLTPPELPPPPRGFVNEACRICRDGTLLADLPEITAWSCGHWIRKHPRSIAELFQDMLRSAFRAGAAAATTGESFETWYQREVLQ